MKIDVHGLARALVIATATLCARPAMGALQDRGPQDPRLVFPQWYRDSSGLAVGLCRSQAPSPNPLAGLSPMCFPAAADLRGFTGNLGPELFYNNLTVKIAKPGFSLKYVAALEASYVLAGVPIHGNETVFARVRIVIDTLYPGTYTVRHPFGVEVFPDVPGNGARSVFFTADIPIGTPPMDFDAVLAGRIGPFIQWDHLDAGETLTIGTEQFLGDPNYPHTYAGSPFATNFVQVDGPPGADLDGNGNGFVHEPLGLVLGQRWVAPIPTPFNIRKAVYSRSSAKNVVDVWASSAPGQLLVVTGTGMPSLQLAEFPGGNYHGHIEYPSTALPPALVTVSNLSSVPVSSAATALVDQIGALAAYSPADRTLTVTATSTDQSLPTLTIIGQPGGIMTTPPAGSGLPYTFTSALSATELPPMKARVQSSAGGFDVAEVVMGEGRPMNAPGLPVASDDAPTVAGAGPTAFDVKANDSWSGAVQVLVLTQPTTGTVVAAPTASTVVFTPRPGASGADAFTYVLRDAVGVSNVATVSLDVPFVPPPPTANADDLAMLQGTAVTRAVLANDVAGPGTTLSPGTLVIVAPPAHGTATANLDGTVTYRPVPTFGSAVDTFAYAVANGAGVFSSPATVRVSVFANPESITFSKAMFVTSKSKWIIVGATSWFGAALTQTTATCWVGTGEAPTASTVIGSARVDADGKFQVVPPGSSPTPPNPSSLTCQTSNGGRGTTGVALQ
jgi:Bacterial Ig domain